MKKKRTRGWGNHGSKSGFRGVGLWGGTAADKVGVPNQASNACRQPGEYVNGVPMIVALTGTVDRSVDAAGVQRNSLESMALRAAV